MTPDIAPRPHALRQKPSCHPQRSRDPCPTRVDARDAKPPTMPAYIRPRNHISLALKAFSSPRSPAHVRIYPPSGPLRHGCHSARSQEVKFIPSRGLGVTDRPSLREEVLESIAHPPSTRNSKCK